MVGLNYGLLALGLVLVYKTNRILNFAQGQLGVVAAVFLVKCTQGFKFDYWFSLLLALGLAAAMGALSELLLRRLFNRPRVLVMVATIGLSQVLFVFTALPFILPHNLSAPFPVPIHLSFTMDGFVFSPGEVLTLIVAPVVALALAAFVKWSPWGLAMRAMSENADSARLSGVWVRRTSTVAWTLAGVLSAFTAILASPGQTSVLTQPLSPDLLLFALTAALVGAMVNLTVAFVSGIAVGIIYEVLAWNITSTAAVQTIMFALLLGVLLVRVAALRKGSRTEERSTWLQGSSGVWRAGNALRARVGTAGVTVTLVVVALLPLVLSVGKSYLLAQICLFGVVALSLTVLTGWAGQVSLGQFGLVAVGAVMAAHLGGSVPLVLLLPFAGASPRWWRWRSASRRCGCAASTWPSPPWPSRCGCRSRWWPPPAGTCRSSTSGLHRTAQPLLDPPLPPDLLRPQPGQHTGLRLVLPRGAGGLGADREGLAGPRHRPTAGGGARQRAHRRGLRHPIVRTKLLAFALSGFMAGYAGVCLAFASERFSTDTFSPALSILVVSMVVIGGLGSIPGAVLGAVYLVGLPAIFGTTSTIQFLTSGFGLLVFLLYLPGGLAEVMHRFGDVTTDGVRWLLERPAGRPGTSGPAGSGDGPEGPLPAMAGAVEPAPAAGEPA